MPKFLTNKCFVKGLQKDSNFCNASWDGTSCWPATSARETAILPCSEVLRLENRIDPLELEGNATRTCSENATWSGDNLTDYTACFDSLEETLRKLELQATPAKYIVRYILYCGSIASLLCLVLSLFIFHYFKSIRCNRITLHIHMMLALLLRCIITIFMTHQTIFKGSYNFRRVDWFCKIVYSLQFYTTVASIHWMFVQGHYLNSKLTNNILLKKFPIKTYVCIGWGIPSVIIGIWTAVTESLYETKCWKNFGKLPTIWILVVPMTVVLLINVVLLVNILRVVLTKSHTQNYYCTSSTTSDVAVMRYKPGSRIKRGTKATAILFPLLGIANLIFCYNPGGDAQKYYMVANASLQSFQGIVTSVLYCFICREVRDAIRREYYRFRIRCKPSFRRPSFELNASMSFHYSKSLRSQRVQVVRRNDKLPSGPSNNFSMNSLDGVGMENPGYASV